MTEYKSQMANLQGRPRPAHSAIRNRRPLPGRPRAASARSAICNLQFMILAVLLLVSCSSSPTTVPSTPTPTPIPTPTPTPPPPSPDTTATVFLDAWEVGDYGTMYARLSPASQAAIDAESFTQRYQNAMATATVLTVTKRLQSALQEGDRAHVSFELRLDTALVGTLITDTVMSLSLDEGL